MNEHASFGWMLSGPRPGHRRDRAGLDSGAVDPLAGPTARRHPHRDGGTSASTSRLMTCLLLSLLLSLLLWVMRWLRG